MQAVEGKSRFVRLEGSVATGRLQRSDKTKLAAALPFGHSVQRQ